MTSVADVVILLKVGELGKSCGLKASEVDGFLNFYDEDRDPNGEGYFQLSFAGRPGDPERREKFDRFASLLNMEGSVLKVKELSELEDIVDHALSLAPRARAR